MPRAWLYFIAMVLPLVASVIVLHTDLINWLWYNQYADVYNAINALRGDPQFLELVGGWALPVFTISVFAYWIMEREKDIQAEFLLLPIAYVPFTVLAHLMVQRSFDSTILYAHPLVIIPFGYIYVLPWVFCVWALAKLRIVI